jgi:integrase
MAYLYKRPESANWWIRLKAADPAHRVNRSLGTPDKREAELRAIPYLTAHREYMAQKPRFVPCGWIQSYPLGLHTLPNGRRFMATAREIFELDDSGAVVGEPGSNGGPGKRLEIPGQMTLLKLADAFATFDSVAADEDRPRLPARNSDDEIFAHYLKHGGENGAGITTAKARGNAEAMWHLYKTICVDDKGSTIPLAKLKKDDGRKIVAHLLEQKKPDGKTPKNSSTTVRRKMSWLKATVNHGINEHMLDIRVNPFSGIVPNLDDEEERLDFSEEDMALVRANLNKLTASDQLLLRLLATTGMRFSEAHGIDSEEFADGVRFVRVGADKGVKQRMVPLPTALLADLPSKISKPLFDAADNSYANRRLNVFIRDCGIIDSRKTVHSFRHRAGTILDRDDGRPFSCYLLGHSEKGSHKKYVHKTMVELLERIDRIGM